MPLRVGLTHTQIKIGWAYKRLDELKGEVAKFRKDAYFLVPKDDVAHSRYRVCVVQKSTPDPVSMLIGEFAYSLRSSLDNLAWQLALLTTDTPGHTTAFPVESECPGPGNRGYSEKVANISPAAIAIIESLQPYTRWPAFKSHPLWQLNKLCNIDKHRSVAISHTNFSITALNVSAVWMDWETFDNAVVVSVPLAEKLKLQLNVEVPSIEFGEPIDRPDGTSALQIDIDGLNAIYNFVRHEAVPQFTGFFP